MQRWTLAAAAAAAALLPVGAPAQEANPLVLERIRVAGEAGPSVGSMHGWTSAIPGVHGMIATTMAGKPQSRLPVKAKAHPVLVDTSFTLAAKDTGHHGDRIRRGARGTIYDLAAIECDRLLEKTAKTCRLDSFEVTVSRPTRDETYPLAGRMILAVTAE